MPEISKEHDSLKFIDLFAGIGGFHLGFEGLAECVFASEIDELARETYRLNFSDSAPGIFSNDERFFNQDITEVELEKDFSAIPGFDILCGGFPCQPFSTAGKRQGFSDTKNRGLLFNNILHILSYKNPDALFLENVRGLRSHRFDKGKTLDIIQEQLQDLGYFSKVFDVKASDFGLPQHRPRLFIIGFKDEAKMLDFDSLAPRGQQPLLLTMSDIFGGEVDRDIGFTLRLGGRGSGLGDRRNWDEYLVDGKLQRLQSHHGLRMQGFPATFAFPPNLSESARMRQLGNSVAVPAIRAFAKAIVEVLRK